MRAKMTDLGFDTVASSSEEFAHEIHIEVAKWAKVVRQAGIKVE